MMFLRLPLAGVSQHGIRISVATISSRKVTPSDVVHGKTGLHPMAQPQNGMLSRLKSDFTPWELHPIRITSCYLGGHCHGALVEFEPLRKVQHSLVISVLQLYLHCLLHVWWYLHCWLLMNISILNLYFLGKFAWWLVQIRKIFFIISP